MPPKQPNRKTFRRRDKFTGGPNPAVQGTLSTAMTRPIAVATVFPARTRVRMTYTEFLSTVNDGTTPSTSSTSIILRLNDVFAPRLTGHQPYAFDTMASLYRRYHVYACDVEVTATSPTSTNGNLTYALSILRPSGATFTLAALVNAADVTGEKPLGRVMMLNAGGNRSVQDYRAHVDIATLEGLTPAEYDANSSYRALATASPALVPTLQLANTSISTSISCYWRIRLSFDVEFYDRVILAQS